MKKYILYLLIAIAFFAGQFLGTQDKRGEELLRSKFEQEQQAHRKEINELLARLAIKEGQSRTIREKMREDSLAFAGALERNKRAYSALKEKYHEINFNRASVHDLDSLRGVLFSD